MRPQSVRPSIGYRVPRNSDNLFTKMNTIILKRPNIKLAKLVYKYMEEPKEATEKAKETVENSEEESKYDKKKELEAYPPYNFTWFVENKIAAMGWPQTVENLNYLVDVGINHLITLSPERVPPILDFERKLKWTEIRIKEFGAPTLKQILKFIDICERAEIRGDVSFFILLFYIKLRSTTSI